MKSTEKQNCRFVQDLFEAFLDDAVSSDDKLLVESHVRICTECLNELQFAEQAVQALRSLPVKACPQPVSKAVFEAGQNEPVGLWQRLVSGWANRRLGLRWRPILATAAIAAFVFFAALIRDRQKPPTPQISPEELARVELDVKWTLAYLGNLSQKTGLSVRDKVLEPQVVAPIHRALRTLIVPEANK